MRVLMIAIAVVVAPLAQTAQFSVEAVKAAYLFRFAQYVEWPPLAADAPFIIAVSGAEDVAVHLDRLLPGMSVNGHRVEVRRVTRGQELHGVHILYIGADAFARTRTLRARAVELPILVVTDNELGLDGGGVINFIEIDRDLRFEISLIAADRSGTKIGTRSCSRSRRGSSAAAARDQLVDGYPNRSDPVPAASGWPRTSDARGMRGLSARIMTVAASRASARRFVRKLLADASDSTDRLRRMLARRSTPEFGHPFRVRAEPFRAHHLHDHRRRSCTA